MLTATRQLRPYLLGLRDATPTSATADLDALDLTNLQNLAHGYGGLWSIALPNVGTNSPGTITISKPFAPLQYPYVLAAAAALLGGFIGYKVRQHYYS